MERPGPIKGSEKDLLERHQERIFELESKITAKERGKNLVKFKKSDPIHDKVFSNDKINKLRDWLSGKIKKKPSFDEDRMTRKEFNIDDFVRGAREAEDLDKFLESYNKRGFQKMYKEYMEGNDEFDITKFSRWYKRNNPFLKITISFVVETPNLKTKNILRTVTVVDRSKTMGYIKALASMKNELENHDYWGKAKIINVNVEVQAPIIDIFSVLQRGVIKIKDDYLENGYDTECVMSYLYQLYGDRISKEKIYESMFDDGLYDYKRGMTIRDISKFCDDYNITHRVIDAERELVHCVERSSHLKVLAYCCMNNHLYPLVSPKVCTKKGKPMINEFKKKDCVYEDDMWESYAKLCRVEREDGLVDNILVNPNKLSLGSKTDGVYRLKSFKNEKTHKERDVEWEKIKKRNNLKEDSLFEYIQKSGLFSVFNPEGEKFLDCNKRASVTIHSSPIPNLEDLKAVDIKKCRYVCQYAAIEPWYVYDAVDTPVPFNQDIKDIKPGYYQVENWDELKLQTDIVSRPIIKHLRRDNYKNRKNGYKEVKIIAQYLPSTLLDPEVLRQMIYNLTDVNDNECIKYLGCMIPGLCGMRYVKKREGILMSDYQDSLRGIEKNEKIFDTVEINGEQFYLVIKKTNIKMLSTGWSFYNQVLDNEWLLMQFFKSKINGEIVAEKTDCIIFKGEIDEDFVNDDESFNGLGTLRYENPWTMPSRINERKGSGFNLKEVDIKYLDEGKEGNWTSADNLAEEIVKNDRVFIEGRAGTGKTEILKALRNKSEGIVKVVSPTNISAVLCGGQTIHRGLHYVDNIKRCVKVDVLIIDEYSQVSSELWDLIMAYIHVWEPKVYIFGCRHQHLPVDDRFDARPMIRSITNVEYHLKYCKRSDTEVFDACTNIINGKRIKIQDANDSIVRAITKSNDQRTEFNDIQMNKLKKYTEVKKSIVVGVREYDQDKKIANGTPMIPLITVKGKYMKNEPFVVINHKKGKLKSLITGDKIEIDYDHFIVNWATTSYRTQGLTIDYDYVIIGYDKMDYRSKYVSVSRAKKMCQVYL